jgi:hypothetical protein
MTLTTPTDRVLPSGFEALAKYVPRWCAETTQERWNQRATSSMAEILEFYEDMLSYAESALKLLDLRSIGALRDEESRLLRLLLSLASCAMAVELHHSPRALYSPFPHGVTVIKGAQPYG